ncbi:MAG TPA: hypothetical protein PLH91_05740 [Tenuifilaceae bacterium]|nr:hypothetical protein [Tenuifilaceae bacterium]HPI44712.1 hypothetical protein [Tenuifilaceae bacterium]HPN21470.1 hypothetical protein [Tenuifilaceae bacterium]
MSKKAQLRKIESLLNPERSIIEVIGLNEFRYFGKTMNLKELLKDLDGAKSITVKIQKEIPAVLRSLAYLGGEQPLFPDVE